MATPIPRTIPNIAPYVVPRRTTAVPDANDAPDRVWPACANRRAQLNNGGCLCGFGKRGSYSSAIRRRANISKPPPPYVLRDGRKPRILSRGPQRRRILFLAVFYVRRLNCYRSHLVIITIYSLFMVFTLLPFLLVGLVRNGIRLFGIFRTIVILCLNPFFSNISAVK